jgi:hypothetical protein
MQAARGGVLIWVLRGRKWYSRVICNNKGCLFGEGGLLQLLTLWRAEECVGVSLPFLCPLYSHIVFGAIVNK